jgi:hypothetical protein
MKSVPSFDIAISYASQQAWLAKDLHDLLTPYGLSVYCYERMPDEAKGFLRERLRDIYATSKLNILIWSESYSKAASDSFPAMERRFLVHRHVNKGEAESLLSISVDSTAYEGDLDITLVHSVQNLGVVGLEHLVVERMRSLRKFPTAHGIVFHPPPTDKYRSEPRPCGFKLDSRFQNDPLKRWEKLTIFPNDRGTKYVYLIPSGLCTVFLRHTVRFRTQTDYLEAKRLASIAFSEAVAHRELSGFWFLSSSANAPEREVVTLYCPEYDRYLNDNFEKCLNTVRSKNA